jgi:prevent-host-death family protein
MRTVSHRELGDNSTAVLRAVSAAETVEVTNHGEAAAVLVPPLLTPSERLIAAGTVEDQPKNGLVDLRNIQRVSVSASSTEIIRDVRGDR